MGLMGDWTPPLTFVAPPPQHSRALWENLRMRSRMQEVSLLAPIPHSEHQLWASSQALGYGQSHLAAGSEGGTDSPSHLR